MNALAGASRLLVEAAAAAPAVPLGRQASAPNMLVSLFPFALIFVIFYFLLIQPQRKQQKETEAMHAGLRKGDRVVTNGGLHATIVDFKEADKAVVLEVAQGVRLTYDRKAVGAVKKEAVPPSPAK